MSFIHNSSPECSKEQLDLFDLPATQLSVEDCEYVTVKPLASLDNDSPIEFAVPPSEHYTDVSRTFLHLTVSIEEDNGDTILATDDFAPVNNFLHSLFSNVSLSLNSKLITSPSHLYGFKRMLEVLFNYNESAKTTHQTMPLFYKDTPGKMNDMTNNTGICKRRLFVVGGKKLSMFGRISVDIMSQHKYLLNHVGMNLTFTRAKPSFCLMATGAKKFQVKIEQATLHVLRMRIAPSIKIAHEKVLLHATAKYPISRTELKSYTIPTGVFNYSIDNMTLGQLPIRVFFVLVSNKAFNGNYVFNPYYFNHYSMNYVSLTVDGVPVNGRPLQPCFSSINTGDDGYAIDREEYASGYTTHGYDLTSDRNANGHSWGLRKNGTLGLELRFETDTLPNVFEKPAIFIVNTDKAGAPGQHWVSIYISKKGHCEYFDSFGMPPYIPAHVDFINRHKVPKPYVMLSKTTYNHVKLNTDEWKALVNNEVLGSTAFATKGFMAEKSVIMLSSTLSLRSDRVYEKQALVLERKEPGGKSNTAVWFTDRTWGLRKNGTLGLELRFETGLPETVNCVVYLEYNSLIEIDKERRVTTDY
ncbi:hypothetical protein B566_EDAN011073 [Ephemera danica]|nr:hypothetical protein B566_EDAN011073 [Ephemera danica]